MVYNRTAGKSSDLIARGAQPAASIAQAAAYAGVVLTMLTDDAALTAVCRDSHGLIESLPADGVHVVMGTHSVQVVRSLAAAHGEAGQVLLAAPVLGRPEAVTAGKLGVIVAGDSAAAARLHPLFESLGRRVFAAGSDPGSAAAIKLANNLLLACAIEAMGEAFCLVRKCGVDVDLFHDVITDGLFASPAYNSYARIIADESWNDARFTVELALKDVSLALAAGAGAAVPMPSVNVCRDRLLGALSHGDGQLDWAAMALEQARASGLS